MPHPPVASPYARPRKAKTHDERGRLARWHFSCRSETVLPKRDNLNESGSRIFGHVRTSEGSANDGAA
jgi:hypothetical protein